MTEAILIERDYKGHYERFALTPEEFQHQFTARFKHMPAPDKTGASCTLSMQVYIWYRIATVGDPEWTRFFSDMSYGLMLSDVISGNLAIIREDLFVSLRKHLSSTKSSKVRYEALHFDREFIPTGGVCYDKAE